MAEQQFVFAYGSLVADHGGRPARLGGHRRVWGVAMDNAVDVPGYKSYRMRADGRRPLVFVAFLDVEPAPDCATVGALLAVDDAALAVLDARERNYERIDVTAAVAGARGTVWTYRGSAAGRARLRRGLRDGVAVVDRGYLDAVRVAFAALGLDDDADPGALPIVDLERIDLPRVP